MDPEAWEREAILRFYCENGTEGYRRVTFMILDRDIVAVSPSTVYRLLKEAGLLKRWNREGFEQPESPQTCRISTSVGPSITFAVSPLHCALGDP